MEIEQFRQEQRKRVEIEAQRPGPESAPKP
jgi:hypothetical protein